MTNAHQHTDELDEDATGHLDDEADSSAQRPQPDDADREDSSAQRDHLDGVEDGCGCTEIWEHLSENRKEAADD